MQDLWGGSNLNNAARATPFTNTSHRFPRTGMLEILLSKKKPLRLILHQDHIRTWLVCVFSSLYL
jgi:hypothetical protein